MPAGSAQPKRDGNPLPLPSSAPEWNKSGARSCPPHRAPSPLCPWCPCGDACGRGTEAKPPGLAVPTVCQPARLRSPACRRPGQAAPGTHPAQDPAPGSRTPYSPPPPAAAHGARGRGGDSRGRAEHAAQPRLPGEASARLTYFSFRITCFHFPSPRLGPPARPWPHQVTPPATGAQALRLPPHCLDTGRPPIPGHGERPGTGHAEGHWPRHRQQPRPPPPLPARPPKRHLHGTKRV